jgi:hypothetical protein
LVAGLLAAGRGSVAGSPRLHGDVHPAGGALRVDEQFREIESAARCGRAATATLGRLDGPDPSQGRIGLSGGRPSRPRSIGDRFHAQGTGPQSRSSRCSAHASPPSFDRIDTSPSRSPFFAAGRSGEQDRAPEGRCEGWRPRRARVADLRCAD